MMPRIAMVCPNLHAKVPCNWREFGDPDAVCPEHRRGVIQENAKYMGKPTPTA